MIDKNYKLRAKKYLYTEPSNKVDQITIFDWLWKIDL